MPCRYDGSRFHKAARRAGSAGIHQGHHRIEGDESAKLALKRLQETLQPLAPLIKDAAFKDEAEWRLISPPFDPLRHRFHHRPGKTFIVPYMKFSYADNHSEHVITGMGCWSRAYSEVGRASAHALEHRFRC